MAKRFQPTSPFDIGQIRAFVKKAQDRVGGPKAWDFIGPEMRRMVITAEAFHTMAMQMDEARFGPRDMRNLENDMARIAGCYDDE